jgi:hypothetical protein
MVIRKFLGSADACNEGEVRSMYLDNRGFVTTGVGNLLPDGASASRFNGQPLTWERIADGIQVAPTTVAAEFDRVNAPETKTRIPDWAIIGGGNFINRAKDLGIVTLRLTNASFGLLFKAALDGFEATIKGIAGFEDYEKMPGGFPADAQIGIISVVWANGPEPLRPGNRMSDFTKACKERRWGDIAALGLYSWSNIRADRDACTQKVFQNAQNVESQRQNNANMDVTIISAPFSALTLT